ncbi:MAG: hypothetical protein AUG51_02075 [Acidobacteria bacterium 13_1_20CM_3_53_8]|nr:MAG: hypothetical protein AUG51_02075 [Acidobacteria bacterium 13_1_20CM_3_53_8]
MIRASIRRDQGTAPVSNFPERGEQPLCAHNRSLFPASSHIHTFNVTTVTCSEFEARMVARRAATPALRARIFGQSYRENIFISWQKN